MTVKYKESFEDINEYLIMKLHQGTLDEQDIKNGSLQSFQLGYQAGKDNGPWHPGGEGE